MPRRPIVSTSLATVAVLAGTLTACGVGQNPETYRERPTVDAALASVGQLELRNVRIEPPRYGAQTDPAGGQAALSLTVVNTVDTADRLTSVSTPSASTVVLLDGDGKTTTEVALPGRAANTISVVLRSLTAPLRPGQTIPVTFDFATNGRQVLQVPVAVYTEPAPKPTEKIFAKPEGSGEG